MTATDDNQRREPEPSVVEKDSAQTGRAKRKPKWYERTSVTLCVAAALVVVALGFIHVIIGVDGPNGMPFHIVRRASFGYRETVVDAARIEALPYFVAKTRFPLGCAVLQAHDYLPGGPVFEAVMAGQLHHDMRRWQDAFDRAMHREETPWEEWLQAVDGGAEAGPEDAAAYNARGIALAGSGQYESALAAFTRACQKNPVLAEAFRNRALVYRAVGNLGRAVSDLSAVIEIKPEAVDVYLERGRLYAAMNQHGLAVGDFTKAIEIDPGRAEAWALRSLAYYADGAYDKAQEDVRGVQRLGLGVPAGYLAALRRAITEP